MMFTSDKANKRTMKARIKQKPITCIIYLDTIKKRIKRASKEGDTFTLIRIPKPLGLSEIEFYQRNLRVLGYEVTQINVSSDLYEEKDHMLYIKW